VNLGRFVAGQSDTCGLDKTVADAVDRPLVQHPLKNKRGAGNDNNKCSLKCWTYRTKSDAQLLQTAPARPGVAVKRPK
jgi:hypothetical protein